MSELSKLVGAPRTDVLPGYTIARARISDFGQAEEEFERRHMAKAAAAAIGLPEETADKLIKAATDDVANGRFKYGRWSFDAHAKSPTSMPYLLFLLLRHAHTEITRDMTESLVTTENEAKLSREVLIQFGYGFEKADSKNGEGVKSQPEPTGPTSSPISDSASDPSVGTKSPT
jgi:hypothetical protein